MTWLTTISDPWWPILGICALRLTHPKCTAHTQQWIHTHLEQWAAIYAQRLLCGARGVVISLSRVRFLAQGHLVVVLKVERALYIHSPPLQFLPTRNLNSQPFNYESDTLNIRTHTSPIYRCISINVKFIKVFVKCEPKSSQLKVPKT